MKGSRRALMFALVAIAAPTAQAAVVDPQTRHHHPEVAQPTQAAPLDPRIWHGRFGGAPPRQSIELPTRTVVLARTDGFDWGDAGIGAASAVGAVLVAGGFALLCRRPDRVAA